jgi:hypothetical protein
MCSFDSLLGLDKVFEEAADVGVVQVARMPFAVEEKVTTYPVGLGLPQRGHVAARAQGIGGLVQ